MIIQYKSWCADTHVVHNKITQLVIVHKLLVLSVYLKSGQPLWQLVFDVLDVLSAEVIFDEVETQTGLTVCIFFLAE